MLLASSMQWLPVQARVRHAREACAGVPLELHQPTVERMRAHYDKRGMELNAARLRMATLPSTAEVGFTLGTSHSVNIPEAVLFGCSLL